LIDRVVHVWLDLLIIYGQNGRNVVRFESPLVHGVVILTRYDLVMSLRDRYILHIFLEKGLTVPQIFGEALTLLERIYAAQENSQPQEAVIYERHISGEFRTVFTFGYKIHFIPRNTKTIKIFNFSDAETITRELALYWGDYGEVEKLINKYQLGKNKLSIFNLALRIYFEIYSGIQNESIFYLNGTELKEILPKLS